MSDGLRIGITFWYGSGYTDIWQNGAGQNLYFLYQVLKVQPNVREVYFVHWLSEKTIPEGLEVDSMGVPIRNLWDVLDTTDIVIEANLRVMSDAAELMRQHGILIRSYKMGPAIVEDMDAFCNSIDRIGAFSDTYYDGVWLIPQFMKNTHDYLEIIMQTRVQEAPHLWMPFFFDLEAKREGIMDTVFYKPSTKKTKRIVSFEPNSLAKTSLLPAVITEEANREEPESIECLHLLRA